MLFSFVFSIDKDVIKVHYYENIKLLYQNLINVALESSLYVGQSKKHYLVLEIVIVGSEGYIPLIVFSDSHLMVGIG